MLIISEDRNILLVNDEFVKLSGFTKEEIEEKKSWVEFIPEEDLERMKIQHDLRRKNKDKALRNYEFKLKDKFGNIKNIFITVDIITGTTNSVAALLDITERKQSEEIQKTLFNISNAVNTVKILDELFAEIRIQLSAILDTTNLYVVLYDEKTEYDQKNSK